MKSSTQYKTKSLQSNKKQSKKPGSARLVSPHSLTRHYIRIYTCVVCPCVSSVNSFSLQLQSRERESFQSARKLQKWRMVLQMWKASILLRDLKQKIEIWSSLHHRVGRRRSDSFLHFPSKIRISRISIFLTFSPALM